MTDAPRFSFGTLHHVQLAMPRGEEETARAFWAGLLRMTELEKPPVLATRGGCWFRGGADPIGLRIAGAAGTASSRHGRVSMDA